MLSSSQAGFIAQVVFSTMPASSIYLFRLIPFQLQGDKPRPWARWLSPARALTRGCLQGVLQYFIIHDLYFIIYNPHFIHS